MLKRELSRMASAAILAAAALACQEVDVQGADRFPRPEFRETAYEYPRNQHPAPRSAGLEAMDTVALLAALAAAALLARRLRSHRGLVALSIACLAWFGFGRQGCVCPVGSVQNVISGLVHSELVIPLSVLIFFAVPLGFALFFGRVFCAAVCPLGAVQELALVRPIAVPLWLDQPLRALPWLMLAAAALGAAIGIGFPICRADPFVTIFRLSGSAGAISAALVALLFSALVGRPYCRYLCPYGALLGLASRVACWPTAIAPDGCIRCRLCENACPYGAILMPDDAALRDAAERSRERRILACCLLAFPLFIAAGAGAGYGLSPALANAHPAVRTAAALAAPPEERSAEQQERYDAFYQWGGDADALYAEVEKIQRRAASGACLAGGFFGLIVASGLLRLTMRRKRSDYEAHSGWCLACGRCYEICPRSRSWALRRRQPPGLATSAAADQVAPGEATKGNADGR